MAKVKARGMKLWYATAATSWTAIAAGADPGGSWTQITDIDEISIVPFEVDEFDDSSLEDTAPELDEEHKPGTITVKMAKNAQSVTLDGLAINKTSKAIAVTYRDGTARYNGSCRIIPTAGGDGSKGNFTDNASEAFKIKAASGTFELKDHS